LTTPASVISALPGEKRKRKLVKLFLGHLEKVRGQHWTSLDYPEDRVRTRETVEVIAMEDTGRTTAIEHCLLDGFAGSEEAHRSLAVFLPIEQDPSLRVPGLHVDIAVSVGLVPTGIDWNILATGVRGWCARNVAIAPEGCSTHVVMVSGTPLKIHVEKARCPEEPGRLLIMRSDPPVNFWAVVQDRLKRNLGKLVSAAADRRVLMFEKNDVMWGAGQLRTELETAWEFPDLSRIDEIWMVDTLVWETEDYVAFRLVMHNQDN
jgi:hypothetical protein